MLGVDTRIHRLVCSRCNRPIVDVQTWDDGGLMPLAPVTGVGQEPTGVRLNVRRAGRIHDVSEKAEPSGWCSSGPRRDMLVCRGRNHRREWTVQRVTLWETCRSTSSRKVAV